MNNVKVKKIFIESFRGIPNSLGLNFTNTKGQVCSAIIYGGNGSGKSSIIDAIEFNLQARIERSKAIRNLKRPSALSISFDNYQGAHTTIEFDDGETNNRDIDVSFDQISEKYIFNASPTNCHESFSFSPVVLRRNDIISFNICPVDQKQVLLSEFFYDFSINQRVNSNPEVLNLRNEKQNSKEQRKLLLDELYTLNIPFDKEEINKHLNYGLENLIKARFVPTGKKEVTNSNRLKISIHPKKYYKSIELAKEIDQYSSKIKEANKKLKAFEVKVNSEDNKFQALTERYDEAATYLSRAFKEISNADYVSNIGFSVSDVSTASFEILVTLKNGWKIPPERIFSEANYDLMILLLYISMIRVGADKGQSKVLVLDDVLQSVDATIRTKFLSYVLRDFNDWQLFITCHDRAWLNQLRHLFKNARHKFKQFEITKWSFENGPVIQESNPSGRDERLKKAIQTDDVNIVASTAGPFFEMICEKLSGYLNCQIRRNPEDKYTIGDLWRGVKEELLRIGLKKEVSNIDDFLFVRNMIGCHYSTWAEETSDYEILSFAKAVQSLYEKTFCGQEGCMSWISGKTTDYKACHCGELFYKRRFYSQH